jgi:hypothetical protein
MAFEYRVGCHFSGLVSADRIALMMRDGFGCAPRPGTSRIDSSQSTSLGSFARQSTPMIRSNARLFSIVTKKLEVSLQTSVR